MSRIPLQYSDVKESNMQQLVRLAASKLKGVRLFRNNVAMAWTGDVSKLKDGSVLIRNPRPLHAGLQKGSGDLIGWQSVTITPDMVGQRIAKFVSVEIKTPAGRESDEQKTWKSIVNDYGGKAIVARSPDDLKNL